MKSTVVATSAGRLRAFVVVLLGLTLTAVAARSADVKQEPIKLIMPDGQLQTRFIRVFVTDDITMDMKPVLHLYGRLANMGAVSAGAARGSVEIANAAIGGGVKVSQISRHYPWVIKSASGGPDMHEKGTLLLFDMHDKRIPWYMAMVRVMPSVTWNPGDAERCAIGETEVYIANTRAAVLWSLAVMAVLAFLICLLSWRATATARNRPACARLFASMCNRNGSLSISQVQVAAWTMAIGTVVFWFSLIRLEVPDIPPSLVALMGLSLLTGGLGSLKRPATPIPSKDDADGSSEAPMFVPDPPAPRTATEPPGSFTTPMAPFKLPMRASDLITYYDKQSGRREVSVAKAQMIFWTVLTLVVFVAKSVTDGTLWPVPWQMVALMGMSQAGYVAPKLIPATAQQ